MGKVMVVGTPAARGIFCMETLMGTAVVSSEEDPPPPPQPTARKVRDSTDKNLTLDITLSSQNVQICFKYSYYFFNNQAAIVL
jgi:hypothetical protein